MAGLDFIKDKDRLYRLIISQLSYDGYNQVAKLLTQAFVPDQAIVASDELARFYRSAVDAGVKVSKDVMAPHTDAQQMTTHQVNQSIDFEFESDVTIVSPEASTYQTCYVTAHKAPVRAADFTNDGMFVATGSLDATIKILDVERMLAKNHMLNDPSSGQSSDEHPTIRTLYDHTDEVTTLAFHPQAPYLLSGGRDEVINIFDWGKSQLKKAKTSIQEASPVRSLSIHPSGDYFVAGCEQPTIRLYDIHTAQCYVSSCPRDQHVGSVNMVKYCQNAHLYASAGEDGSIKVWDGVSNRCVQTIQNAHAGEGVCSVEFTKNAKYLLSSGKDSIVRLWELASGRPILVYTGAELSGKQQHRAQAHFNHTEDYVVFPCERSVSLCCWNSRTGERQRLMPLGHNSAARWVIHSPTMPAMLTCSDDFRARFWYYKGSQGNGPV